MKNIIDQLLLNKILLTAALSWLVAGVLKVIVELAINKKLSLVRIIGAGGMPSSHTSTVVSLAIATGYYIGLYSADFAISVILAIVVVHDAVGVRLETGKQAKILNKMVFDTDVFEEINMEKRLKEYVGHTPLQVLVGGIVGIIVSIICIYYL